MVIQNIGNNREFPSQRNTMEEKQNIHWYKKCYDYLIDSAISMHADKRVVKECLDAANGIIDLEMYQYVMNPLSADEPLLKELPGVIRDVDFMTPIKEKNIGEYINLPYSYNIRVNNSDVLIKRNIALKQALEVQLQQLMINMMNQQGMQTGVPTDTDLDLEKFRKEFIETWVDDRAIEAKQRLDLLNELTNFEILRIQNFYNWWATEEFYTYRYIDNGEVRIESISPMEGFPIDNGEQFVEDMVGFVHRFIINKNELIDKYRHRLSDDDWTYLNKIFKDAEDKYYRGAIIPYDVLSGRVQNNPIDDEIDTNKFNVNYKGRLTNDDNTIIAYRVCWKTEKQIKILVYQNSIGETVEAEVSEDYEFNPEAGDIAINTEWINTVITGYRFGNDDYAAVYLAPEEELVQRRDKANSSMCKLPFGGKRGLLEGIKINPIPKRLVPYLALYRIYTLHQERTIAKYKGTIDILPKGLLGGLNNAKKSWYYAKADNTIWYDETDLDFNTIAQGIRQLTDGGIERYIIGLAEIRKQIREEAWDLANMNDERYGNIGNQQTVTNAQSNMVNARLGSTLMIHMFNKALERDHTADLEFSKYAWIEGKQGSFIDKETGELVYVGFDGDSFLETDAGVFVRNSELDKDKLQQLKQLAFSAGQNGDFEMATEAILTDDVHGLKKYIKDRMNLQKEHQEALNQLEQLQGQMQQMQASTDNQARLESEEAREMARLDSQERMKDKEMAMGGLIKEDEVSQTEDVMNKLKMDIEKQKLALKDRELELKTISENNKLVMKSKDIAAKERIAKMNKNKYDSKSSK